jgi:hypothetical protein
MIVRFFKTGTSNGECAVRYLMRNTGPRIHFGEKARFELRAQLIVVSSTVASHSADTAQAREK